LAAALAAAQQGPTSNQGSVPVFGTVTAVSGNVISVQTGRGVENVTTNGQTEVWKGKYYRDLSPVQVGDRSWAFCDREANGTLVARQVWLNIVNFSGVITKLDNGGFEMLTNPNADPQSSYVKKELRVSLSPDTVFDASAREDLRVGRGVQMVGVELTDGTVRATRLTVYEGGNPVRVKPGAKVLLPNGTVRPSR